MHSIRKFVGRGTIALALAALVALAVAVQSGQAARSTSADTRQSVVATSVQLNADPVADLPRETVADATPSAACVAAANAVKTALASDRTEDTLESANATPDTETGAEQTEDTNEAAALKPLLSAVAAACGPFVGEKHETVKPSTTRTPPTAQCAAAIQALKAAFAQQRAQAMAEFTSGTEGTAADMSEDQAAKAQIVSLFSAVKAACGTSSFDWDHR